MAISYAYIENHNPAAPRLAFFAKRDIMKDEELTFNYMMRRKLIVVLVVVVVIVVFQTDQCE